jgi:predicted DNA-binding ribbon-helix-helix protein
MTNPHPYSRTEIEKISERNQAARHIVAGFLAEMPLLSHFWQHLDTALADNLSLSAEVARLSADLAAVRLDRANLLAAMRAAIAAHADREPDPLYYIRDELNARQMPAQRHGRTS